MQCKDLMENKYLNLSDGKEGIYDMQHRTVKEAQDNIKVGTLAQGVVSTPRESQVVTDADKGETKY